MNLQKLPAIVCLFVVLGIFSCKKDRDKNAGRAPLASFDISSSKVKVGEEVVFTDQSTYVNGDIVEWEWDFGDGGVSRENSPVHIYNDTGRFVVRLTVTGNKGLANENDFTRTVTVEGEESATVSTPPEILWQYNTGTVVRASSPAISPDGIVYVGTDGDGVQGPGGTMDNVFAIKAGNKLWSYRTEWFVRSSPAVGSDGTVYIGSYDKNFYAFSATGSVKWKVDVGDVVKYSSPALSADQGTVFVGSNEGSFYAINTADGSVKWNYIGGKPFLGTPSIGSDGSVFTTSIDGNIYAFDPGDGSVKWKRQYGTWDGGALAIGSDGTIYLTGDEAGDGTLGVFMAINPSDGAVKWAHHFESKSTYGGPVIAGDGTLYIILSAGILNAYTPSGDLKWSYDCNNEIRCTPAVDDQGNVYFGDYKGIFYVVSPEGKNKYQPVSLGSTIWSSPLIDDNGVIYIGTYQSDNSGVLYALKTVATGPADSPWPMRSKNSQRTSNYAD